MPTRFRYRPVAPLDFGLQGIEILLADDKDLNQVAPIRSLAPYRRQEQVLRDQVKFKRMGSKHLEEVKKSVLKIQRKEKRDKEAALSSTVVKMNDIDYDMANSLKVDIPIFPSSPSSISSALLLSPPSPLSTLSTAPMSTSTSSLSVQPTSSTFLDHSPLIDHVVFKAAKKKAKKETQKLKKKEEKRLKRKEVLSTSSIPMSPLSSSEDKKKELKVVESVSEDLVSEKRGRKKRKVEPVPEARLKTYDLLKNK